ncbi:MAG TPA: CCA tRNA nucleotidyltransferase [Terriglobales bacterium]|nr:CCA tRNA nucleotidyltransferase [Terriglobales bacterium]
MADYIYTMEIRLTPDQQKGVTLVQDIARAAGMNVYLTGGTIRDIISGYTIRDLDFTVQGNPLRLQKELERAGAAISDADDDFNSLYLILPGNVRAEISMARTERYEKTGKPPVIAPASMVEDLRRRDFTVNAMALSLNPGSRGLLMDPFNGVADIEAKLLRILHNYAFVEDPSRLIRATRFVARFHWPLEERTQARFNSAKENNYIEYITNRAIGYEIEQIAYEDDPLHIVRALEKEEWLKVLHPHWTTAKVDAAGLSALMKSRQQMNELGYSPDPAPAVLYFLTDRLGDKDVADIRKLIPRKDLIESWRDLDNNAKELAKKLTGKEAATPSRTWKVLSEARPEMVLFLSVTSRQQAVQQKIKNFFTKWRQVQQRIPLPEMTELLITPQLLSYPKIAHDVFMLLLDGKLRSRNEILKFLKPFAPPPPPPPPPPTKRGRAAKAGGGGNGAAAAAALVKGKKKGKTENAPVVATVAQSQPGKAPAAQPQKSPGTAKSHPAAVVAKAPPPPAKAHPAASGKNHKPKAKPEAKSKKPGKPVSKSKRRR